MVGKPEAKVFFYLALVKSICMHSMSDRKHVLHGHNAYGYKRFSSYGKGACSAIPYASGPTFLHA